MAILISSAEVCCPRTTIWLDRTALTIGEFFLRVRKFALMVAIKYPRFGGVIRPKPSPKLTPTELLKNCCILISRIYVTESYFDSLSRLNPSKMTGNPRNIVIMIVNQAIINEIM